MLVVQGGRKFFRTKKRIVSGVEKLEIMRFLMEGFTPFSSEIEILPISFYYIYGYLKDVF
ncbi:hypothetical protein [Streptococcus pneumoniae]|uniref:hypothetical protein n=1 Tax=Streptococcus pneumoniae TaxID=1313 RepID=UPI00099FF0D8|nr:hypothetical protein [Streptococcus pneumoniae]